MARRRALTRISKDFALESPTENTSGDSGLQQWCASVKGELIDPEAGYLGIRSQTLDACPRPTTTAGFRSAIEISM